MDCPYYRLTDPRLAGAMDWEGLIKMERQYPHLIPCGARRWHWVYRDDACRHCDHGRYIPPKRKRKKANG